MIRHVRYMQILVPLALGAAICSVPVKALAQDVFDRLQSESLSMLDYGVKRLRSAALQTIVKLQQEGDLRPQSQVFYDPDKREIHVQYVLPTRTEGITPEICRERRAMAIRELFFIGGTSYSGTVSPEQRVLRRLGAMFTKEPIEIGIAVQATGERLSDSTFVKMTIPTPGNAKPVVCNGRVNDLRLK